MRSSTCMGCSHLLSWTEPWTAVRIKNTLLTPTHGIAALGLARCSAIGHEATIHFLDRFMRAKLSLAAAHTGRTAEGMPHPCGNVYQQALPVMMYCLPKCSSKGRWQQAPKLYSRHPS